MKAPSSENNKTECNHCGAAILHETAKRTGGFCMPHRFLGFPFQDRAPAQMTVGDEIALSTASREFKRSLAESAKNRTDSPARFAEFMSAYQPGDTIRRFTGEPVADAQEFYPSRGLILKRGQRVIQGVVTEWAFNDRYAVTQVNDAIEWGVFGGGVSDADPIEVKKLVRDIKKDAHNDRLPDYFGSYIREPTA